ncbi:hypothetical protein [Nitrosospira sp. Nsp14]|uniref:hypothetical protein n=1 Tax=Nitrosospira sp. Nsp14 TaxID=1855333 RepID=UPI0015A5FA97|nr:hypothetical protein [Nitrosospira sp. Nsp14]
MRNPRRAGLFAGENEDRRVSDHIESEGRGIDYIDHVDKYFQVKLRCDHRS